MKTRIITSIAALALFIPVIVVGGWPLAMAVYLLSSIALFELLRMKHIPFYSIPSVLSFLLLWILIYPKESGHDMLFILEDKTGFLFFAAIIMLAYTVFSKNRFTIDEAGFIMIAVLYVGCGFYYFLEMRRLGLEELFFALLSIWTTDTGAYFVGKSIGKKKLLPEISPNKTVEGLIGGILSAVAMAIIFQYFTNFLSSYTVAFIAAVFVSIFGQLGDLVESAFKRHYGVKDSGAIFPGHGGVLDRFDSLLFILPILYFLIHVL